MPMFPIWLLRGSIKMRLHFEPHSHIGNIGKTHRKMILMPYQHDFISQTSLSLSVSMVM